MDKEYYYKNNLNSKNLIKFLKQHSKLNHHPHNKSTKSNILNKILNSKKLIIQGQLL